MENLDILKECIKKNKKYSDDTLYSHSGFVINIVDVNDSDVKYSAEAIRLVEDEYAVLIIGEKYIMYKIEKVLSIEDGMFKCKLCFSDTENDDYGIDCSKEYYLTIEKLKAIVTNVATGIEHIVS